MKVYKTQVFDKWAKKEGITNSSLKEVIDEMIDGLIIENMCKAKKIIEVNYEKD